MSCPHCLRGDAQNLDMQRETIDKTLSAVDEIGSVLFTGGEPSLNLPIIEYFFEEAEKRGKLPASMELITNGKKNQTELAMLFLKWYAKMDTPELCYIGQSKDDFHEKTPRSIISALKSFEFHPTDPKYVINEGRAAETGVGKVSRNVEKLCFDTLDDGYIYPYLIYVNAEGKVVFDCNLSYETQQDISPCGVENLRDYIEKMAAERICMDTCIA